MKTHNQDNYNNREADDKAKVKRSHFPDCHTENSLSGPLRESKFWQGPLSLRSWPVAIVLLLLTVVLWTVVGTGRAEQESSGNGQSAQTESEQGQKEQPQAQETQKTDDKESAEKNGKSSEKNSSASSEQSDNGEQRTEKRGAPSPEDEFFELFLQYSEAEKGRPDSPETQALKKKLDEARVKIDQKLERDPHVNLQELPAAPAQSKPKTPLVRRSATSSRQDAGRTSRTNPPRSSWNPPPPPPRDANQPNAESAEVNEPEDKDQTPSEQAEAQPVEAQPAEAQPVEAQPAEPQPAEPQPAEPQPAPEPPASEEPPSAGVEESTNTATASKGEPPTIERLDGNVKIKTTSDLIDVNMLLEMIGKELKLNFIYPKGTMPTGQMKLQQYGDIHRRELLPLLESVLAFAGFRMVKDGPFVQIVQDTEVFKQTEIFTPSISKPTTDPNDLVVVQVVELEHVTFEEVKNKLAQLIPHPSVITASPIDGNHLFITDYAWRVPRLLEIITLIDQPGPERHLKIISLQYMSTSDAKREVLGLFKVLNAQSTTMPSGPEPAKPAASSDETTSPGRTSRVTKIIPPTPTTVAAKNNDPDILEDSRTNRLFVIGTDEQIEQFEHLLSLYDVDQPGPQIKLTALQPEYVLAKDVKTSIESLIKALNSQGGPVSAQPQPQPDPQPQPEPNPDPRRTTPSHPTTQRPASTTVSKAKDQGPYMQVDERTNRLLVVGSQEQIEQVEELLSLFDVPVPGPEIKLAPLPLEHVTAAEVAAQIEGLIKALNDKSETTSTTPESPKGGTAVPRQPSSSPPSQAPPTSSKPDDGKGPYIQADERTNRLLVVGSDEQIEQVRELLSLLDVPAPGPEIKLAALPIEHVTATEVAEQINNLILALNEQSEAESTTPAPPDDKTPAPRQPSSTRSHSKAPSSSKTDSKGPYIQADERMRRLLVVGSDEQIDQVKELLSLLDVPAPGGEVKLTALTLKYLLAEKATEQIGELIKALAEQENGETKTSTSSSPRQQPGPGPDPGEARPPATPSGSQQQSRSKFVKTSPGGPYLVAEIRTNRLLVIGTDEQTEQVLYLLSLLDIDIDLNLVPLRIKHVMVAEIASQLADLMVVLTEQEEVKTLQGVSRESTGSSRQPSIPGSPTPSQPTSSRSMSRVEQLIVIVPKGPYLLPAQRTNRLLVIGNDEQINQVKGLLGLLDVDIHLKLEAIQIKHILSSDIAQQIADLIAVLNEQEQSGGSSRRMSSSQMQMDPMYPQGRYESNRYGSSRTSTGSRGRLGGMGGMVSIEPGGPYLLPDERTNRLLIVGTEEQIVQVKELLPVLDVPPGEYNRMQLKIYQPQYVEAAEVQKILDDLAITKKDKDSMRPRDQADRWRNPGSQMDYGQRIDYGQRMDSGLTGLEQPRVGEDGQILFGLEEPEIRVAIQESTNRIFIYAAEYQLRDIEAIMEHIDMDPNDALGTYRIYKLENQTAEFVSSSLEALLEDTRTSQAKENVDIPGLERKPTIVALEDICSVGIRASTKQHQEIERIIKELDRRMPQVLVEAILVQISTDDALKLGISAQNAYSVGGTQGDTRGIGGVSPFGLSSISKAAGEKMFAGGTGGTVAFFDDDFIYATLEALQTQTNSRVISKPRVLINSEQEAVINSKRQKPTTKFTVTGISGIPVVEFAGYVDAGTELKIKPSVSEGREGRDFLSLEITLAVDNFEGEGSGNVPPPKSTNNVTTNATIPDGKVIILGGLTRTTDAITVNKIPILGDIPLLGVLFRNTVKSQESGVLYVFVKANIVKDVNFEDLENITEESTIKLDKFELNYEKQSFIPGLPNEPSGLRNRALDDKDYRAEEL